MHLSTFTPYYTLLPFHFLSAAARVEIVRAEPSANRVVLAAHCRRICRDVLLLPAARVVMPVHCRHIFGHIVTSDSQSCHVSALSPYLRRHIVTSGGQSCHTSALSPYLQRRISTSGGQIYSRALSPYLQRRIVTSGRQVLNKYCYCCLCCSPELVFCQLKCMLFLLLLPPLVSQLFAGFKKFEKPSVWFHRV
jgi:hypothetical protein